jgi:hypothetical protein
VPLEPIAIKLLKSLATMGEVIPVADSTFYGIRQKLCKEPGHLIEGFSIQSRGTGCQNHLFRILVSG